MKWIAAIRGAPGGTVPGASGAVRLSIQLVSNGASLSGP